MPLQFCGRLSTDKVSDRMYEDCYKLVICFILGAQPTHLKSANLREGESTVRAYLSGYDAGYRCIY